MSDQSPAGLTTRGRLMFLFRDSALYGTAAAVSRIATLVTFPIIVRHLSAEEYGLLDFMQVLGGFLTLLFVFGQESAVARYFFEYEDRAHRRQLISQSLSFQILGLLVVLPILWNAARFFSFGDGIVQDSTVVARLLLAQVPFLVLINFSINILRITFSRFSYIFMSLGYSFTQAILWISAIFLLDMRIEGILLASLISAALFALIGLVLVRSWIILPRGFRLLREMLPYAIPYGFVCSLDAATPLIERALVKGLLDANALGLYAAGAKVSMLFAIALYAFQVAWNPFALALHKSPDAIRTYNWVLKLFALGVCLVALLLASIAEPLVVLLASERYAGSSVVVFPLVMGFGIGAIGWITEIGINFAKRTHLKFIAYVIAILCMALAIAVLAPVMGLFGAAMGVLIGNLVRTVILTRFAQVTHPMGWDHASVASLVMLTLVFGLAGTFAGALWGGHVAAAISLLGACAVLLAARFVLFSADEREAMLELLRRVAPVR